MDNKKKTAQIKVTIHGSGGLWWPDTLGRKAVIVVGMLILIGAAVAAYQGCLG